MSISLGIDVGPGEHTTALAYPAPAHRRQRVSLVLAHGAGAGQTSDFMVAYAEGLAARGIATLTFNFLYMETGRRLPDRSDKLEACCRKVVGAFHAGLFAKILGRGALVIGGKSMGGRIASQIAAADGMGVSGLLLLGYPLHPPGRPKQLRAGHLTEVKAPMLFVQGERDPFGTPAELRPVLRWLGPPASLCVVEDADHSFKVPKRGGRSPQQVKDFVMDEIERWIADKVLAARRR